jgi:signal transduction histidine kinase
MHEQYTKILTALSKLSVIEVDFTAFCTSALYYLSTVDEIHAAAIYVPSPFEDRITPQQVMGSHPHAPMPAGRSDQARYGINSMHTTLIDDLHTEERFRVWPPLLATDLRAGMMARYHMMLGRFGLLAVYSNRPSAFATTMDNFGQMAANMIALVLERSSMAVTRKAYPLDHVSDMAFIIGRDWYYVYANQAASRATRARKSDLLGQSLVTLYEDIDPEHLAIYERVMAERTPQHFRAEHILPRGVRGEYNVQVHPVPEGILCLAQATSADTTFNEREQRLLAETMQDIALVLNATLDRGQVLRQILVQAERVMPHQAAAIILAQREGYDVVTHQGEESLFCEIAHEALADLLETGDTLLLRDRSEQPGPLPLEGWVASFVGVPIHLNNSVIGFLCLGHETADFFSLKHARRLYVYAAQAAVALWNARLYENERRERELAQTLQDIARTLSSPNHIDSMLTRTLKQVRRVVAFSWGTLWLADGYQLELGAHSGDDLPVEPPLWVDETDLLVRALREAAPLTLRVTHIKDANVDGILPGTRIWVGVPLTHRDMVVGVLSVGRSEPHPFSQDDINALTSISRQAALAIINAMMVAELETKINALQEARDSAARSARLSAMGEMAMGIAHQINNPLTAVIAQASLAERVLTEDHPAHRAVQSITKAAQRAASTVQRMFELGRMSEYDRVPVQLAASITDTASLVRAQLDPKHTTLLLDLADDLPTIMGSPQHLEDVWINLMLNARDAVSDKQDGEITVRAWANDETQQVIITITDNGVGIPPEYLEEIFTPFFTTKPHGTGLGIPICYEVVSKHGGTMHVESEQGHGTTFSIHLPYSEEQT